MPQWLGWRVRQVAELFSHLRGWERGPCTGSGGGLDREAGRKQEEIDFSESKKSQQWEWVNDIKCQRGAKIGAHWIWSFQANVGFLKEQFQRLWAHLDSSGLNSEVMWNVLSDKVLVYCWLFTYKVLWE